jgi:hypothetical protein
VRVGHEPLLPPQQHRQRQPQPYPHDHYYYPIPDNML